MTTQETCLGRLAQQWISSVQPKGFLFQAIGLLIFLVQGFLQFKRDIIKLRLWWCHKLHELCKFYRTNWKLKSEVFKRWQEWYICLQIKDTNIITMQCTILPGSNIQVCQNSSRGTNKLPLIIFLLLLEPIGSSSPKFGNDEKSSTYVRHESNAISLLCSAQAFPYPSFR